MSEFVRVTADAGVMTVRLNRPDKKNALTGPMYAALTAALTTAESNDEVRAVVFCGVSGCFSAGNDLKDFIAGGDPAAARPAHALISALCHATVPLIAAVDGVAIGIGTTLLLHCDFVYATPRASFALPFVDLGVCPEAGSTLLLPRLVGYQRAAELLMLGEAFNAETANRYGLVTAVCGSEVVEATALATARKLAAKPPQALRETKQLMKRAEETVEARVKIEIECFNVLLRTAAAREIMTAFVEKRAPDKSKY